jgi:hypothetical protein
LQYVEWLEYHFFYGLGNVSYRASSVTNGTVFMVGPPRIRQHRAGRRCEVSAEWKQAIYSNSSLSNYVGEPKGATCWDGQVEEQGGFESSNANFTFSYHTSSELEEVPYSTKLQGYSGDGYLLHNVSQLLKRLPTRHAGGTEFYQYAHSRIDADDFIASGWLRCGAVALWFFRVRTQVNSDAQPCVLTWLGVSCDVVCV